MVEANLSRSLRRQGSDLGGASTAGTLSGGGKYRH